MDKPKTEVRQRAEKASVKSIAMKAPVFELQSSDLNGAPRREQHHYKIKDGLGARILRTILGKDEYEKLNLDDAALEGNLRVNVAISYFRTTSASGQRGLSGTSKAYQRPRSDSRARTPASRSTRIGSIHKRRSRTRCPAYFRTHA